MTESSADSATTADDRRPDLDIVREQIEMAHDEVHRLCAGGRWTMQVPARPSKDSDLVISAALAHADWLLAEVVSLRGRLTAATSDERLDEAVDWWFGARGQAVTDSDQAEFRRRMRNAINAALGGA